MATTSSTTTRPWYCADQLVEEYKIVGRKGGDLKMMKAAKWFRSMVVNVGIITIALYGLYIGGDTTIISGIALVSLAAYNGVEIADYQALAQAIVELSHENSNDEK